MSVEIVREAEAKPSVLSQELSFGDIFAVTDKYDGDFAVVVLSVDKGKLMLFDLDDLGNRWDDSEVETVRDALELLDDTGVTSIEYFRQPQIDIKVCVGESVKVL